MVVVIHSRSLELVFSQRASKESKITRKGWRILSCTPRSLVWHPRRIFRPRSFFAPGTQKVPLREVDSRRVATANKRRVGVGENRLDGVFQTRFVVDVMEPTVPLGGNVGGGIIVEVLHDDPTGSTLLVGAVFIIGITRRVDADEFALASFELPVATRKNKAREKCQSKMFVRSFVRSRRTLAPSGKNGRG